MASFDGTYSCGHSGSVYYPGRGKDNQWRADRDFAGLCPECAAQKCAADVATMLAEDAANGLPALTGSEKQLNWALGLRRGFCAEMDKMASEMEGEPNGRPLKLLRTVKHLILSEKTTAHWWIDNRMSATELSRLYISNNRERVNELMNTAPAPVQADDRVAPEHLATPVTSEILLTEKGVQLRSDKDETVRTVVRDLGYRWDGDAHCWMLGNLAVRAPMTDRLVELGSRLLNAGCAVIIHDPELRARAVRAEYEPQWPRWVTSRGNDFSVSFPRDDTVSAELKTLTRASWDPDARQWRVAASHWQALLDFAAANGFRVSPGAEKLAQQQEAAALAALTVQPAPSRVAEPTAAGIKGVLDSSTDVLPDLRDDEDAKQ